MDIATLSGILLGVALILGSIVAVSTLGVFFHVPSLLITVGGTVAATLITAPSFQWLATLPMNCSWKSTE